jgi:toxin-antitoxin system PIN domain toxin
VRALLDVNVLLALSWQNHVHYDDAHEWFANHSADGWGTCLLTQAGFLRLSLNPQVVGTTASCDDVVAVLHSLTGHPHHQFVDVGPTLTFAPFDELSPHIVGHRQVTDATLLHIARFHAMKLVTFDQGISVICPWQENLEVIQP